MSNAGQAALTIVGGVVGFWIGGPTGAAWGMQLGGMAGSVAFPTDLGTVSGPRLDDLSVQSSAVGAPIPILFGTYAVSGNLIWSSGIIETVTKKKQGGKGGPTQTVKTYSYKVNCAVGICEGEINSILRIWADAKLIYDARPQLDGETDEDFYARLAANADFISRTEIYTGTSTQLADPTIESFEGAGNVSAFRDLAYVVFSEFQLADYGNRIPNFRFEVSTDSYTTGLEIFLADGTWEKPAGATEIRVIAVGGGGGGGGAQGLAENGFPHAGGGGGGGGFTDVTLDATLLPDSIAVTVGQGGAGGAGGLSVVANGSGAPGTDGTDGTDSTFGSYATAGGGDRGRGGSSAGGYNRGGDGGTGTVENGGRGGDGSVSNTGSVTPQPGGSTTLGAGAGGAGGGNLRAFWEAGTTGDGGDATRDSLTLYGGAGGPGCSQHGGCSGDTGGSGESTFPDNNRIASYTGGAGGGGGGAAGGNYNTIATAGPAYGGDGGNGGLFGAGGGGGGAAQGRVNTDPEAIAEGGDGGAGADGFVIVIASGALQSCLTLGDIVERICLRAGLSTNQIDVSDLTECVDGYALGRVMTARDAITPLRTYGFFDCVESGAQLKWPTRGKAEVATLTEEDLAAHPSEESRPTLVEVSRVQEVELPRRMRVHYSQTDQNYEPGEQSASRLAAGAVEVQDVEIPIAMSSSKAAQIAEVLLYESWVGRNRYKISLGQEFLALEPADVVTMPVDGRQERVRITSVDLALPGLLQVEAIRDDDGAYVSYAVGSPNANAGSGGATVSIIGTPETVLLDIPLLSEDDNDSGYYAAVRSIGGNTWSGGAIYRSPDGGITYSSVAEAPFQATIGTLDVELPAGPSEIMDKGNELLITLPTGFELESIAEASLLAGLNAAAIGADGRWEIVQFQTAEQVGSGSNQWRLTNLLRGRRGTEWAIGLSQAADKFVLLDEALVRISLGTFSIGVSRKHKTVFTGQALEDATEQLFTGNAVALKPFSPVHVSGTRDSITGDITIEWIRRDRLGQELQEIDLPMSEGVQSYEVDVYDGTVVVRTLVSSTTSVTYTSAQQAADFGSPVPDSIQVGVYQLSSVVGRGYEGGGMI